MRTLFVIAVCCILAAFAQPADPDVRAAWEAFVPVFDNRINPQGDCFCAGTGEACATWENQLAVLEPHTAESYTHQLNGVGSFGPKPIALEYNRVILGADGTDCNSVFRLRIADIGRSTYHWINDRCLEHGTINNLTIDYRAFGGPLVKVDGLPVVERLCFDPSSGTTPKLTLLYSVLDEAYHRALAENAGQVDVDAVCGLVQAVCTPGGEFEQYSTFEECVAFMNTIPHSFGPCPTSQDSNTVNCRFLHALVAALPEEGSAERHCPHTAADSVPCADHCLPACAACTEFEHCADLSEDPTQPDYQCVCNDGYAATGADGECEPVECTQDEHCVGRPGGVGVCNPETGLCGCKEGFKWDSTFGRCYCPQETHFVSWEGDDAPECVPRGRCYTNQECSRHVGSHPNSVSCVQYGTNPYAPWKTCVCNPGFEGGFQYPCTCNGRVAQSSILGGKVCLHENECVRNNDCPRNKSCHIPVGGVIGTCQ